VRRPLYWSSIRYFEVKGVAIVAGAYGDRGSTLLDLLVKP